MIEKVTTTGFEAAIRGMRNPMNSWDKSDSITFADGGTKVGNQDIALMTKLIKAGTDHRKFMRMIVTTADITAPLFWWKEFDTYKVGTVRNSCSTMHKLTEKEFTLDDFCHDNLSGLSLRALKHTIITLNDIREEYLVTKDKVLWRQLIELLPSSYLQKSTVQMNYEVLRNIYFARREHKLDEWHVFCDWIETLPNSELITCS